MTGVEFTMEASSQLRPSNGKTPHEALFFCDAETFDPGPFFATVQNPVRSDLAVSCLMNKGACIPRRQKLQIVFGPGIQEVDRARARGMAALSLGH